MSDAKKAVKPKRVCKGPCKGKNPLRSSKAQFCKSCYVERREKQLADGLKAYRARAKAGKAGHNVLRYGKLTKWAKANPGKAKQLITQRLKSPFPAVAELAIKGQKLLGNLKTGTA